MKSIIYFIIPGLLLIFTQPTFAAVPANLSHLDRNGNGQFDEGEVDPCQEYVSGPCQVSCPVTTFKTQCYYTTRCVEEPYTVRKKCTRYVPKTFTKRCCRYIPQYYEKEYCKKVPECYYVEEQKCRTRKIREKHVRYVPCTKIRRSCVECPPEGLVPSCPSCNGE